LNGLKMLVMLLSNWDHKNASDADIDNGILECGKGDKRRLIYYVADWGASLGTSGRKFAHTCIAPDRLDSSEVVSRSIESRSDL
jgi:hypothetical protein